MAISISNYMRTADTFTFPHNPQSFDDSVEGNHEISPMGYERYNMLVSGGGLKPRMLILTGHFDGTSKKTHFRSLAKHFQESWKLKKLYWETDKFYLGVGRTAKQTNAGGRTNFIDYVAGFDAIVGILFGNTEKTSGTNAGDVKTYVTEVTGTVTSGAAAITITDGTNTITSPASDLTTGLHILHRFVQMVTGGGGIYTTEYGYFGIENESGTTDGTTAHKLVQSGQDFENTVEVGDLIVNTTDSTEADVTAVDSDTTLSLSDDIMVSGETFIIYRLTPLETTAGIGLIQLGAGVNVDTIVVTNITSDVVKFRDGWSA